MDFYQDNEQLIQETLQLLAGPRLLAQPHLLLASGHGASMIPCRGIDMILARTSARTPLKFPLTIPTGTIDIVEQPEGWRDNSAATEDHPDRDRGQARRRTSQVEIYTLGGWTVTLRALAVIHGNVQDERLFFAHLPDVPAIPFRLEEGGIGLINTANITRARAWPKPDALPGPALPLAFRQCTPGPGQTGLGAPGY